MNIQSVAPISTTSTSFPLLASPVQWIDRLFLGSQCQVQMLRKKTNHKHIHNRQLHNVAYTTQWALHTVTEERCKFQLSSYSTWYVCTSSVNQAAPGSKQSMSNVKYVGGFPWVSWRWMIVFSTCMQHRIAQHSITVHIRQQNTASTARHNVTLYIIALGTE